MSAIFSPCRRYRYRLDREVGPAGPVIAFFGINPSTAEEVRNDPTVRKWAGFCRHWNAKAFIAGNCFSWVSTDVKGLASAADPRGPDHDNYISTIIRDADILVPCWGNRHKVPLSLWSRLDQMKTLLRASGKPVRIFGLTKSGDPMHPLMLGYDRPPMDWNLDYSDFDFLL